MAQSTDIMMKLVRLYDRFGDVAKTEEMYMNILRIEPSNEAAYILFAQYLTALNRIEDANACYQAGIRHVQTPKLQEEYIRFLKDINNVYNQPKGGRPSSNGLNGGGGTHKVANSNTYAFRRSQQMGSSNVRSPTTLSSSSNTTVSSVGSNAPMGPMMGGGGYSNHSVGSNKQYVPPSPFLSTQKGVDHRASISSNQSMRSRPSSSAAAPRTSAARNSNRAPQRGANGVVATGDEQGCIVM